MTYSEDELLSTLKAALPDLTVALVETRDDLGTSSAFLAINGQLVTVNCPVGQALLKLANDCRLAQSRERRGAQFLRRVLWSLSKGQRPSAFALREAWHLLPKKRRPDLKALMVASKAGGTASASRP